VERATLDDRRSPHSVGAGVEYPSCGEGRVERGSTPRGRRADGRTEPVRSGRTAKTRGGDEPPPRPPGSSGKLARHPPDICPDICPDIRADIQLGHLPLGFEEFEYIEYRPSRLAQLSAQNY
jgi:hypothetical protein